MGFQQQRLLVDHLSPGLQAEVALYTTKDWTSRVWYLHDLESDALVEVARRMSPIVYTPHEEVPCGRALFIIQRGICARKGQVMGKDSVFGEDMIIENPFLRDTADARALSYLELIFITGEKFDEVREMFPASEERIRRAQVWLVVRRGFILAAWRMHLADLKKAEREGRVLEYSSSAYFAKAPPSFVNASLEAFADDPDPAEGAGIFSEAFDQALNKGSRAAAGRNPHNQHLTLNDLQKFLDKRLDEMQGKLETLQFTVAGLGDPQSRGRLGSGSSNGLPAQGDGAG